MNIHRMSTTGDSLVLLRNLQRFLPLFILYIFLLYFFTSWLDSASAETAGAPVDITADSLSYDQKKEIITAEGNVRIIYTDSTLNADTVSYDRQSGDAKASGRVFVRSGMDTLEGNRAELNVFNKTGTVYQGQLFVAKNHFFLRGEKIEKTGEATYLIQDADATTCDGTTPAWHLFGRRLHVTVDGYGTLKDARFMVQDVPILYFPYLVFPAKTTRQTGFLFPKFGYSTKLGWDTELPFFYAISDQMDATFYERYMDKRGFKQGAEFRYAFSPDSFGTLYGDYLNDRMPIDETVGGISRDWESGKQRWSYYANSQTTFSPGFYLRTDLAKVSDPWYFKDFSGYNYYLNNYDPGQFDKFKQVYFLGDESLGSLDSKARAVKEWNTVNLTTVVRYTDDFTVPSNSGTLQKYPELTLTAVRQPFLNTPLQYQFQTAYDYFYRQLGEKGHLYQLQPTVLIPISLYGTSSITPFVNYQGIFWDRDDSVGTSESSQGHHGVYSTGLNFNSELRKVFQTDLGNIDKIQHTIRPEVTYLYSSADGDENIPNFASPVQSEHSITYSLINVLTARSRQSGGAVSYREWMRLKLAQTYYIKAPDTSTVPNNPEIKPFSDVQMELDLSPIDYFSLSVRSLFDVYKGTWTQSNYGMSLKDDRGDILSAAYRYTAGTVEELDINLTALIRKDIYGIYVMRQDLRDNLAIEHTYGLIYKKQCWNVEVLYTETYDDHRYMLLVSLYGLGGVGGGK